MSTPNQEMVHAYRSLYRTLLQAVRYSAPARYIARDKLRATFRDPKATFDADVAKRTLWFLEAAARERGLEHRILKNLLRVESEKRATTNNTWRGALHQSKAKLCVLSLLSCRVHAFRSERKRGEKKRRGD